MDRLLLILKMKNLCLCPSELIQVCMFMKLVFLFPHQQIIQVHFLGHFVTACLLAYTVCDGRWKPQCTWQQGNMSGLPLWAALAGGTFFFFNTDVDLLVWKQQTRGVSPWGRRDRKWTQRREDLKCKGESSSSSQQFQCAILPSRSEGVKKKPSTQRDEWFSIKTKEWRVGRILFSLMRVCT